MTQPRPRHTTKMILMEDWQQSPTFFLLFVIVVAVLLIVECRIVKQHPDEPHTLGKETYTLPWCFSGGVFFSAELECRVSIQLTVMVDWA